MTPYRTYIIECNGCGEIYQGSLSFVNVTPKREAAERLGWVHCIKDHPPGFTGPKPSCDYCPKCVKKGRHEDPWP